jgi:predicted nucleic acid-binding protein
MLYLDSSALVKRYLREDGSDAIVAAMDAEGVWCSCRIAFLETARAVGRAAGVSAVREVEADWREFDVVEVSRTLTERAVGLAIDSSLRSLDSLHLAAALSLPPKGELTFATWDRDLHQAAREHGFRTLPAILG